MKILVVEDEFYSRKSLVETILRFDSSFVIDEAEDGNEALDKIVKSRYELMITDIRMPVIDGLELVQRTRSECPKLAVAILTGYADFDYALAALRLNVREYLLKPVENERLFALLNSVRQRSVHYGDKIVDELNRYIYENMSGRINIAELCKTRLYLDPAYVSRHYKMVTGQNIVDTVRQVRLEHARGMLEKTTCSIGEIAVQCGYQSYSAFMQSFERQFDMSPAEYRRAAKRERVLFPAEACEEVT